MSEAQSFDINTEILRKVCPDGETTASSSRIHGRETSNSRIKGFKGTSDVARGSMAALLPRDRMVVEQRLPMAVQHRETHKKR